MSSSARHSLMVFMVLKLASSGTNGEEVDSEVDSSHWGDIDSLSSGDTGVTDLSRVFSWAGVHDGFNDDFQEGFCRS